MVPRNTLYISVLVIAAGIGLPGATMPALAEPKISKQIEIQASENTIKQIMTAFDRAEKALNAHDLEDLMALYSKDYEYRGLTKKNLRETWKDLFARYRRIASHHIFSKIVVKVEGKAPKASITCTGGIWATAETTGERIIIDSWFDEVHRLVYEDGAWRILGHDGEDQSSLPMGGAHPFF